MTDKTDNEKIKEQELQEMAAQLPPLMTWDELTGEPEEADGYNPFAGIRSMTAISKSGAPNYSSESISITYTLPEIIYFASGEQVLAYAWWIQKTADAAVQRRIEERRAQATAAPEPMADPYNTQAAASQSPSNPAQDVAQDAPDGNLVRVDRMPSAPNRQPGQYCVYKIKAILYQPNYKIGFNDEPFHRIEVEYQDGAYEKKTSTVSYKLETWNRGVIGELVAAGLCQPNKRVEIPPDAAAYYAVVYVGTNKTNQGNYREELANITANPNGVPYWVEIQNNGGGA